MSRNSEVLFSSLPSINIQRSVMDIPFDHKTTFNIGQAIPICALEVLPSDSVKISTSKVVRLQTLLTPLMSNLVMDTMFFFVPNRLVWSHWKEFMGENTSSAYLPEVTYRPPRILYGGSYGAMQTGDILDYFGLPLLPSDGVPVGADPVAFPLRGYWLIWNEFLRDQNLQDPINIPMGDLDVEWKDVDSDLKKPLPVNRLHDYFSSALIAPAKNANGFVTAMSNMHQRPSGAAVDMVPVVTGSNRDWKTGDTFPPLHGHKYDGSDLPSPYVNIGTARNYTDDGTVSVLIRGSTSTADTGFVPDNLYADISGWNFGITIPSLRQAFQMQKFLEREASHGSRYQETLLSHFSVRALDSRLQRPEYLGGNRVPINVMQVVNQAQSSGQNLGDLGAFSLTCDQHYDVEYSATEHGYIIGIVCIRNQKHSYQNGFNRQFKKTDRFSYAWPEFAHLTDQVINNWEIYVPSNVAADDWDDEVAYANGIFGYQERYAEYKYMPEIVSREMRAGISNSLASWHLGDYYSSDVFLSDEWLRESKVALDRALAVTSSVSNQVFGDFQINCRWTRPLPLHSNPGFADHF